jgi:hypothetical protein
VLHVPWLVNATLRIIHKRAAITLDKEWYAHRIARKCNPAGQQALKVPKGSTSLSFVLRIEVLHLTIPPGLHVRRASIPSYRFDDPASLVVLACVLSHEIASRRDTQQADVVGGSRLVADRRMGDADFCLAGSGAAPPALAKVEVIR